MPIARPAGVQSVARAMDILELLATRQPELGVSQLGRELGVHKATASRLVSTLADRGLVEQNTETDKYRLGLGLVRLAAAALARLDVAGEARPVLRALAEATAETVNLAVRSGREVVNIEQITAPRVVAAVDWVGRQTPLHCTANGKALLGGLDRAEREALLGRRLERFTGHTRTAPAALSAEVDLAVLRGYSTAVEEYEAGLVAVAAPVRRADGAVVAAVSVAGPSFRLPARRLAALGRRTAVAAEEISARLGYAAPAAQRRTAARRAGNGRRAAP